jgi:hypothetical protein
VTWYGAMERARRIARSVAIRRVRAMMDDGRWTTLMGF